MIARTYWDGDRFIVALVGRLMGGPSEGGFYDQIKRAADDGCTKAVIDLSDVEWLNSWGVGQLVSAFTSMKNRGGALVLCGCRPKVFNVLQMTRFDSIFPLHPDLDSALAAL
ncbi:MAG: STAS domain-containing protein [bacterium]|nr:STAS domain-containing protein [bacterium]